MESAVKHYTYDLMGSHFQESEIVKKICFIFAALMCMLYSAGCTNVKEMESDKKECIDNAIIRNLNMSVQEILDLSGSGIDELSSVVVFEPNVFFPYIETDSFLIICRSTDVTYTPIYITMYQEDEVEYLEMLQLNRNMNFQEIMEVMGTASVEESKEGAGNKRYMISFVSGELEYYFCSDNQDGQGFELYIGLTEYKNSILDLDETIKIEEYLETSVPELAKYKQLIERQSGGEARLIVETYFSQVQRGEKKFYPVYVGEQWDDHRVNWDWFYVSEQKDEILWYNLVEDEFYTLEEWRNSEEYRTAVW